MREAPPRERCPSMTAVLSSASVVRLPPRKSVPVPVSIVPPCMVSEAMRSSWPLRSNRPEFFTVTSEVSAIWSSASNRNTSVPTSPLPSPMVRSPGMDVKFVNDREDGELVQLQHAAVEAREAAVSVVAGAVHAQRADVCLHEIARAADDAAEEEVARVGAHGQRVGVEVDVAVDVEHGQRARGLPGLRGAHVHVGVDMVGADGIDRADAVGDEDGVAAHEIIAALKENAS